MSVPREIFKSIHDRGNLADVAETLYDDISHRSTQSHGEGFFVYRQKAVWERVI